jgi:hypothetical protein
MFANTLLALRQRCGPGISQVATEIRTRKSLASYRDCLGGEDMGAVICSGRGSFDRGDLKEVALSAGAMEFERISLCNE